MTHIIKHISELANQPTYIPTCTTQQCLSAHAPVSLVKLKGDHGEMHYGNKREKQARLDQSSVKRDIQKIRNTVTTIGLCISHLILQTSRRG